MENKLNTFFIPDSLCCKAGIAAAWLPINGLSIFANEKLSKTNEPSIFAQNIESTNIFHLRHEITLFKPILRQLLNESNGIFIQVQNIKSVDKLTEILSLSKQYRSIIRACIENLKNNLVHVFANEQNELENLLTIFYSIECTWHLCEILFLNSSLYKNNNLILPYLLEWVRFHFSKYEKNAEIFLNSNLIDINNQPEYWETVIGCLLHGRIKVVKELLLKHSDSDMPHFKLANEYLKTIPIQNNLNYIDNGITTNEFLIQWKQWINNIKLKIESKQFIKCYNLNLIMKVIVGDLIAWDEIQQQYCDTWYELLPAWLYYTKPTIKLYELGNVAKECITRMSIRNQMKQLDRILLAAMEFDIIQVIKEIENINDNGWFATHFTDLLYHANKLLLNNNNDNNDNNDNNSDDESNISEKLRESFLIDYGSLLIGHKSLWQIGLNYLDYCPNDGLNIINLLLPRLSLYNEYRTNKIYKEAIKRNLFDTAQNICKIQGMKSKNQLRWGNTLLWAIKSQDNLFISNISDHFLMEYIRNGSLNNEDLLNNLSSLILTNDRLIFLVKYYEFHSIYREKNYKNSATLLINLLESKIIPKFFWTIILIDTIPLLECEEIVFSSIDTYIIMQALEEKEKLFKNKENIELIRLATARNLARALLYEAELK